MICGGFPKPHEPIRQKVTITFSGAPFHRRTADICT
jgi:hypothetical protein